MCMRVQIPLRDGLSGSYSRCGEGLLVRVILHVLRITSADTTDSLCSLRSWLSGPRLIFE
jgi:hypothetical protein